MIDVDVAAIAALLTTVSAGGGALVRGWVDRRGAGERTNAERSAALADDLLTRVRELEAELKDLNSTVNNLSVEVGELRGDLRARDGRIKILEEQLADRTAERDAARAALEDEIRAHAQTRIERDRLRVERGRAVEGLVTAAHVAPSTRPIAEAIIPHADEAHSMAGRLDGGPGSDGLHSLSEPSDPEAPS